MSDLTHRRCQACKPGTVPLSRDAAERLLSELPDWRLSEDGRRISRAFKFENYYQTIAFVNAIAWMTHREDHHPDLDVSYNQCVAHYSTHSIGGLSDNDFICAAKVQALFEHA